VTQAQIPQDLVEQLEGLRSQAYSLYQASTQTLSSEAETARKTGDRAELVLWILAAMALVVSLFVSVSVLRSIATPLRHLAEGTRAIAEGKEFYRLDTSRNDEFSQIAKDFNTLARRLRSGDAEQNGHQ
jgi:methyl-accepting chemotaxis protein